MESATWSEFEYLPQYLVRYDSDQNGYTGPPPGVDLCHVDNPTLFMPRVWYFQARFESESYTRATKHESFEFGSKRTGYRGRSFLHACDYDRMKFDEENARNFSDFQRVQQDTCLSSASARYAQIHDDSLARPGIVESPGHVRQNRALADRSIETVASEDEQFWTTPE